MNSNFSQLTAARDLGLAGEYVKAFEGIVTA